MRDNLEVFNYFSASEIWPDKRGGLIRGKLLYIILILELPIIIMGIILMGDIKTGTEKMNFFNTSLITFNILK